MGVNRKSLATAVSVAGANLPFLGSDIIAVVEALLTPRTRKLLRKRVSGINAIDRMLWMVARLLLVAEIELFED